MTESTRATDRGALAAVFLVVLVDLLGFGLVLPLLAHYGMKYGASAAGVGVLYGSYSMAQLVFAPVWGAISDRVGRRPVMLVSTAGAVLAYLLFAVADSYAALLVSRILAGVMGGNISTAQAYVADVTSERDRAKGMGLIGAAFGIGFVLGPALAALLTHPAMAQAAGRWAGDAAVLWFADHGRSLPGWTAAGLSALSFCLVALRLPESKPAGAPAGSGISRSFVLSGGFWKPLLTGGPLSLLLACSLVLAIGHSTLYSAFPIYCQRVVGLEAHRVGLQFAWMGLISVLIQGGLIRRLVQRYRESSLFIVGSIVFAVALLVLPLARTEGALSATLALLAIGASLNAPTLTSLISKRSDPASYGRILGSAQGFSALGRVIGPVWGGVLAGWSPIAPFAPTALLVGGLVVLGVAASRGIDSPSRHPA